MTQNLAPGPSTQLIGTTLAQVVAGASYALATGTITTATSTVTASNIGLAGNVTVYIYGTYAGVNVTFEISPDNTNWFPVSATREDNAWTETTSGVLPANTLRAWTTGAPGFSFFRVRATAWTSGTANIAIVAGTYPFEPLEAVVPQFPGRVNVAWTIDNVNSTAAADTLMTVTESRDGAATTTFTSKTITSGKRLRLTSVSASILAGGSTPALSRAWWKIRVNTAGATTAASPLQFVLLVATPAATAKSTGTVTVSFPEGLEFLGDGTKTIGVSCLSADFVTTTNVPQLTLSITGFEY